MFTKPEKHHKTTKAKLWRLHVNHPLSHRLCLAVYRRRSLDSCVGHMAQEIQDHTCSSWPRERHNAVEALVRILRGHSDHCINKPWSSTIQWDDVSNLNHQCKLICKLIYAKKNSNYKDGICVICSDNTFNSQSESFPFDCGHFVHKNCFSQYTAQGNYKCPCCRKSIGDLSTQWDFIRSQIKLYYKLI